MNQDGITVIGARCTAEDCEWPPLGTDDPHMWDVIETMRLEHEAETGHTVTVDAVEQKTILTDRYAMTDATLTLAAKQDIEIQWLCPECERTGEELGATKRCPDCGERLREVLP